MQFRHLVLRFPEEVVLTNAIYSPDSKQLTKTIMYAPGKIVMGGETFMVATGFAHWRVSIEEKKSRTVKKKTAKKKTAEEKFVEQFAKGMALKRD